jgi:uncharacterized protein (DUF433 family)
MTDQEVRDELKKITDEDIQECLSCLDYEIKQAKECNWFISVEEI